MVQVIFYEKPGCINNTKQKALLTAAGHEVIAHNLLKTPWAVSNLRPFFGDHVVPRLWRDRPITEWFNKTAPLVKSGEVIPENLDSKTALQLMTTNPLLIRRPLIQVGDTYKVGFNREEIDDWIGLASPKIVEDLENCPKNNH